jgi:hypothetical protein
MTTLHYTTEPFLLKDVSLSDPVGIKDFNFSEITLKDEPVYVQLCNTRIKNGICVDENNDSYVTLLIDENSEETLEWFENFDDKMKELLLVNGTEWFENEVTTDDMESAYNSCISMPDINEEEFTFRVYLPKNYNKRANLNIYDEDEELLRPEVLNEDDVEITPLVEFKGIKFDSTSFQLYGVLRQAMVMADDDDDETVSEHDEDDDEDDDDNADKDEKEEHSSEDESDDADENDTDGDDNADKPDETNEEPKTPEQLEEVKLEINDTNANDEIKLKKPNEVYINLWKETRAKAKQAKNEAIKAYLEAKNIKSTWLLDEEDDDDLKDLELLLKTETVDSTKTLQPNAIEF